MSEIVTYSPPAPTSISGLPRDLRWAVEHWIRPEASLPRHTRLSPAAMARAAAERERMRPAMRPVTYAFLLAWLAPMNAGFRNPKSTAQLSGLVDVVAFCVDGWPEGAFGNDARRELVLAADGFWPVAADVVKIVQPRADRMRAIWSALEALSRPPPTEPPPRPRTDPSASEIAAVAASVREAASLGVGGRQQGRRPREAPLSGEHLRAARAANPLPPARGSDYAV